MTAWRIAVAAVLLLLIAIPLALPFVDFFSRGPVSALGEDAGHLLSLAANTLLLAGGTALFALPVGTFAAVLLYRTDLPCRRAIRVLVFVALFVPPPLIVAAWQNAFGVGGWLVRQQMGSGPWAQGLTPAILVNALAVLPAVILLIGQGLCCVEAELEEDALLATGPWRVLWRVTLPRCRAMILAAGLWIVLHTAADVTVADTMQVWTYAGEINVQLNVGEEALARAVALSMPGVFLLGLMLLWVLPRLDRALPSLPPPLAAPRAFTLGVARWPCLLGVSVLTAGVTLLPLVSLLGRVGLHGDPPAWSADEAGRRLLTETRLYGGQVAKGLLWAGVAGVLATGLALLACWAALESARFRAGLLLLIAVAWALPGPVAGIGLARAIGLIVDWFPSSVAADVLYWAPYSPVPVIWAYVLRFFPCAVALLWPIVHLTPRALREAARLDGARPRQELTRALFPLVWRACAWSALVIAALALGELAASARVETPGAETFAKLIFDRLHYGAASDIAALCLVLLAMIILAAAIVVALRAFFLRTRLR